MAHYKIEARDSAKAKLNKLCSGGDVGMSSGGVAESHKPDMLPRAQKVGLPGLAVKAGGTTTMRRLDKFARGGVAAGKAKDEVGGASKDREVGQEFQGLKNGGVAGFARGGAAKKKGDVTINIQTSPAQPAMPPMVPKPPMMPPGPPPGPPPMAGLPPGAPPMPAPHPPMAGPPPAPIGGPPGLPPGLPPPGAPMGRASGGRVPDYTAGAGGGLGRLQKARAGNG